MVFRTVDSELMDQLQANIGAKRGCRAYNEVATQDAIRHFCEGIGDPNPLFTDREYAARTRWGRIIAPPTFLYSVHQGPLYRIEREGGRSIAGVRPMISEEGWEFYKPVFVDDRLGASYELADIRETQSKYAGRSWALVEEFTYQNQSSELVAKFWRVWKAYEKSWTARKGRYEGAELHRYSEEEIKAIERDYDKIEIRRANPRYWDDVIEGEAMGLLVYGPLVTTDVVTFLMGVGGPFNMTGLIAHRFRKAHPRAVVKDPRTNAPDFAERWHWDDELAAERGFPGFYDMSYQRVSVTSQFMTNWIGDDGFLRKLWVELRKPVFHGDTNWFRGQVTGKRIEGEERLVDCELEAKNQRGEITTRAQATALLPSRGT